MQFKNDDCEPVQGNILSVLLFIASIKGPWGKNKCVPKMLTMVGLWILFWYNISKIAVLICYRTQRIIFIYY